MTYERVLRPVGPFSLALSSKHVGDATRRLRDGVVTTTLRLGERVEIGSAERVYGAPAHPYTQALLSALPDPGNGPAEGRLLLPGEIPSPRTPPAGCRFHTRCAYAQERSRLESPRLEPIEPDHLVACHYWREVRAAAS